MMLRTRPADGIVRATVAIELEGPLDVVLRQGSGILRLVVDELTTARVNNVGIEYGEGSTPEHVLDAPEPHLLDLVGRGAAGSGEAAFWELAMRATEITEVAATPRSESLGDALRPRPG